MHRLKRVVAAAIFTALICKQSTHIVMAQSSFDELRRNFISPPNSARPRVLWHWMNGNITQEGIKLDLEWMSRIGLGGVQTFDAALDAPQIVDQRLDYMTPPWKDAFRFAVNLADQLGLELAIASSPGWSESGGPWVKPEHGMKKLVWSETRVEGGVRFTGKLQHPPTQVGPFQDVSVLRGPNAFGGPNPVEQVPNLYRDIAVIAYPLARDDKRMMELRPQVTTSDGPIDDELLWDANLSRAIHLQYDKKGGPAWIQLDFGSPQTMQSMILGLEQPESVLYAPPHVGAELQSSIDGRNFSHVASAYDTSEYTSLGQPPVQQTIAFDPVAARYFRLIIPVPPKVKPALASMLPQAPLDAGVTEFVLSGAPRVDHLEQKAGYFLDSGRISYPKLPASTKNAIDPSAIIDITRRLRPDDTLDWTAPAGDWAILRIGYSLLGITNRPASPEGTGLEVDKLNRSAVEAYMEEYLGRYESILGSRMMGAHGLRAMINDSYESGAQNWTDNLPTEFASRRGYDLRRWSPALTGRVVANADLTDKFLWDFRRTLGELLTENHYAQISGSLHARGITHYGEAHEIGRAFIGDGMDAKRDDDIPMAVRPMVASAYRTQRRHRESWS